MSEEPPAAQQPPPKKDALTPDQIGGCVGAGVGALGLLVYRDLSPEVRNTITGVHIGIAGAVGGLIGWAVVSLVMMIRDRARGARRPNPVAETTAPEVVVAPAVMPGKRAEGNGSPVLRVTAGVVALLFIGMVPFMLADRSIAWDGAAVMFVLGVVFGRYATRGRNAFRSSDTTP